jgi:dihydroflavonol-4-reductase
MKNEKKLILVTGGSGYIATFVIIALLNRGYSVQTTLRTMSRQEEVKAMLAKGGITDFSDLTFVQADLTKPEDWVNAAKNCHAIIHVASPTPATRGNSDDEMIQMAVNGVKFVMEAAKENQIDRVVLTSASGAVLSGHGKTHPDLFTEEDWTNLDAQIDAYQRSKTIAEQEFWKLCEKYYINGSSVLPVAVMGPILGKDFSHSNVMIRQMLEGQMPHLLNISFDYVDVRDVADLHLSALENPAAIGERFLATSQQNISYQEIAKLLKNNLGTKAEKVSTKVSPDWLVKILAKFNKDLKMPATFLGQNTACSNEKAKKMLDYQPRSAEKAILLTAQTMVDLGIIEGA